MLLFMAKTGAGPWLCLYCIVIVVVASVVVVAAATAVAAVGTVVVVVDVVVEGVWVVFEVEARMTPHQVRVCHWSFLVSRNKFFNRCNHILLNRMMKFTNKGNIFFITIFVIYLISRFSKSQGSGILIRFILRGWIIRIQ